jgi:hypothetical protein
MEKERGHDQLAITDFIDNHASYNDTEAEASETSAANCAELCSGKAEVGGPVGKDAATDTKANACRKDRHETRKEEALGVRCNPVSISVAHRFWFSIYGCYV